METEKAVSADLVKLEEIAKKNGRIVLKSDHVSVSGESIFITCDYPDGADGHSGTVEDLLAWESGYRSL